MSEATRRPPDGESEGPKRDRSTGFKGNPVACATAPSRASTQWVGKLFTLERLLDKVRNAPETTNKGTGGCLIGARLVASPGPRRAPNIAERTFLTLDFDKVVGDWTPETFAWCSVAYDTHSSTPESPRFRVVVLFDRAVQPEEWSRVSAALAERLVLCGTPEPDPSCLRWNQIAFMPERRPGVELRIWDNTDQPPLHVDELIAEGELLGVSAPAHGNGHMLRDPFELGGLPGAFNRLYSDMDELIEKFDLPYAPDGDRWRHRDSSKEAGVSELRPGWWFSHHYNADPAAGHAHTAYDLVRIHKFGHLDGDEITPDWEQGPSHEAMDAFALSDPLVREEDQIHMPDTDFTFYKDADADDADDTASSGGGSGGAGSGGGGSGAASGGKRPRTPLTVRMRQFVEANYDVFPAGDDGRVFARPKVGGRAEIVDGPFVIRAAGQLGGDSATLSAAAVEAAKVLVAQRETKKPHAVAMRVHKSPTRIVLDLAQPENTKCVVVTASGWTVEDVPPKDVIFMGSGMPLPVPERGGSVEELRELLMWEPDDDRWLLVKGWLAAVLLATVPRPMLAFIGGQGSTKTSTSRFVVGVFDPRPLGTLGSSFGKNRSDDETKALKSYLPAWDNVSTISSDSADFISRMVTGDYSERRKLYSDTDIVRIAYRRTGVLTAINVPSGMKPDTLDRLILLQLEPPKQRVAEEVLEEKWVTAHPRILAGALDLAVQVLAKRGHGENPHNLRMADYATALWSVDTKLEEAFARNVSHSRFDMAEDDPFISTLLAWISKAPNGEWVGTAKEAFHTAERFRTDLEAGWWPGNERVFSNALTRQVELLRAVGIEFTRLSKSNGTRRLQLTYKKPEDKEI